MSAADLEKALLNLITTSIEDTRVPDAIAAYADKRVGKTVTTKDAEQLAALLGVPVRIRRQYGMTSVAWAVGAGPNPWSEERSLLLAHADTSVRWPSGDELRKKEPAYFAARDDRNAKRQALLQEHAVWKPFVDGAHLSTVRRAACAIAKLREARAELDALLEYGQPLATISSAVEKLTKKE